MNAARRLGSLLLALCCASALVLPQTKPIRIVVLGSSTAEGCCAPAGQGWVALFNAYLTKSGITDVINLASGGATTFDVLPTGYTSPYRALSSSWNRSPDPQKNITKALAYSPSDIIVNLPSNDALLEFPAANQIVHLKAIQALALAQGVRIWFTTTQPTKWLATKRKIQMDMRDATMAEFGDYALDFWSGLANTDGSLLSQFDSGDGVHLNASGHALLFDRVKAKVVFSVTPPPATSADSLRDGGFEVSPSPWTFITNGSGSFSTIPGGTEGTRAARVSIQSVATNVQLHQAPIALQPNTRYQLTFDAYSTTGHDLSVSVIKHVSPYTNYGLISSTVNLGTTWQSFSIAFTTSGFTGTATDARLMFWLTPFIAAGDEYYLDKVKLVVSNGAVGTAVTEEDPSISSRFELFQNFPNPFNPTTVIRFQVPARDGAGSEQSQGLGAPAASDVRLIVYDLLGREVTTLLNGPMSSGSHSVTFDAARFASGVYIYRLTVGTFVASRLMTLVR